NIVTNSRETPSWREIVSLTVLVKLASFTGSHENYQCQPDNQNVDLSGSDQIQNPQYLDIYPLNDEFEACTNANDDEDHSVQDKESPENSSEEIVVSNLDQEKEPEVTTDTELPSTKDIQPLPVQEPPRNSDIHQLIEECFVEVPEEQKQNMEKTMLDLVKICHHKYITPETESDEVTESNAENLLPIPSECEVALEDKRECTVPISENFLDCDNHSDILFDSNNDDLLSDDESFEDIEYVDASVHDLTIASVEEENVVQQEEKEVDFEDISQVQDVVLREKLFSFTRLISNIESLNDNSTPDRVLNLFESDNSLLDNFSPEFETFCNNSEETRSGNTTHANYSLPEYDLFCFEIKPDQERLINLVENDIPDNSSNDPLLEEVDLFLSDNSIPPGMENVANDPEGDIRFLEELLIDNSILSHESSDSNFEDNPLIPRPPSEPPDVETDVGEEIQDVMIDKDKFDDD
nr:hypothetical protein [Tanacetum cinerariifolium]